MEQDKTQHLQTNQEETLLRKCPQCDTIFSAIAFCPNDGTKLEAHHADGMGNTLFADKYEVIEEIGKGGMGTVYRVKQVLLDKILALKVIPSHYLNEQLTVRFQREARTMASLDHPNLARVSDFGIWLNQPFMVMEYIEGNSLSKLISERVIPPAQAVELFCQVLDGLNHAHQKGVLHRDIKPSNIMVQRVNGINRAILLDFGIAKRIDSEDGAIATQALTRTGEMIGSPLYMSPEQARGDRLSERSDLYSLGCALFESLTGTPPFVGKTAVETFYLHIEQTPPTLKEAALGRDYAPGLEAVIRRLLAKNPDDRFASAEELKHALALCLQNEPTAREVKIETIKKTTLPVLPIVILSLASLMLLGSVGLLLQQGEKTSKEQAKELTLPPEPAIRLFSPTIPDSIISNDNEISLHAEANRHGHVTRSRVGSLVFYKQVLDERTAKELIQEKGLQKLGINYSTFPKHLLAKLPQTLHDLELIGVGLNKEDFKAIGKIQNLRELNVRVNVVDAKCLQNLATLQKLEVLDLNGTHIDAAALKELKHLKSLRGLILSDNELIDDQAIVPILSLKQLEWLDISNTRVTPKGLKLLSSLSYLRKLGARKLALGDDDVQVLNNFKRIKILKLAGNPISTYGFESLKPTPIFTEFDLSECPLEDDVTPHLLRFKNLKALHISRTRITPQGFLKLHKLPLSAIWCKKCNLSIEHAYQFLDKCPTCNVVYYTHNDDDAFTREDYLREKQKLRKSNKQQ